MAKRTKLFDRKTPPRSVMVLGKRIRIHYRNHLYDDQENELWGLWMPADNRIFLSKKSPCWKATLLHEIAHACLSISGTNSGLAMNKEEAIVVALESGIAGLL